MSNTTTAIELDLVIESLEPIDAPLSDREWGLAAGVAFIAGVVAGAAIVT
jgi:hypothetical protein